MRSFRAVLLGLILAGVLASALASSVIPLLTADLVQTSDAILRGTVVGSVSFKGSDGLIYTRTSLRVDEPLKGSFPQVLLVVHSGGRVGNEDEFAGLSPRFIANGEYLLFVIRNADGTLHCTQGHASAFPLRRANQSGELLPEDQLLLDEVSQLTENGEIPGSDVTDQAGEMPISPMATTGMLGGVNARFLQPDRGEPIPYLIDADSLPSGISLTDATNAVQQALTAWAAVTSLKFKLEGIGGFGQGADTITASDEKLRIQLHDNYNRINTPNVLGIGGRNASSSPEPGAGWDIGGNVAGNEFRKTTRGYVVLEATNSSMQSTSTLAEVLCHEIGHAMNMAHSSEIVTNDPVLTNAIMYFRAHTDGRGATLGAYDPPVIQQAYHSNTPPFGFDRFIDVTSASSTPAVSGINEVRLTGYDLQDTNLTIILTNQTLLNGSFSVVGNLIKYTPNAFFGFNTRNDPGGNTFKDWVTVRLSDGTNGSPYFAVSVLSFHPDTTSPSDGVPDDWMTKYFGHTAPMAGDKSQATNDADSDGLNNLQEYIAASNPTNATSAQRILSLNNGVLQFQAKAYELYEVLASTNLTNWARVGSPFVPTNAPLSVLTNQIQTNITVTVSNLPTDNPQMFFRILKVP